MHYVYCELVFCQKIPNSFKSLLYSTIMQSFLIHELSKLLVLALQDIENYSNAPKELRDIFADNNYQADPESLTSPVHCSIFTFSGSFDLQYLSA